MNFNFAARIRPQHAVLAAVLLLLPLSLMAAPPASGASAAPAPSNTRGPGTTIMSSEESPIGLYIAPWKNSFTQPGLFAPRKHRMQIVPEPVDPDTLQRQNVYYQTITSYRANERGIQPAAGHEPAGASTPQPSR